MDTKIHQAEAEAIGENFIASLVSQDFDRIGSVFEPQVRFRALVPSRLCEGKTAGEATAWLRRWFGDADEIQVLQSNANQVADRLHMNYRLRVHDVLNGWRVIEQQAYGSVYDSHVTDLWLVCSGFRPDPGHLQPQPIPGGQRRTMVPEGGQVPPSADAFYDAGAKGCAEGPLEEISGLVRDLKPGQSLRVHATDPSVAADLPAWCRLAGHEFTQPEKHQYLIRKKA